jgi:hypothetical protein
MEAEAKFIFFRRTKQMMENEVMNTEVEETTIVPVGDTETVDANQTQDNVETKDNKAGLIIGTVAGVGAGVLAGIGIVKLGKSIINKIKNKNAVEIVPEDDTNEPEDEDDIEIVEVDEPTERTVEEILDTMTDEDVVKLKALIAEREKATA